MFGLIQALSQEDASGCNAATKNLQNIKEKHADQPTKRRVTPDLNRVLPLLNYRGWKQLIFKNVCICKMFCALLWSALCNESVDFVVLTKALFMLMDT
jgi:hypothetical protein